MRSRELDAIPTSTARREELLDAPRAPGQRALRRPARGLPRRRAARGGPRGHAHRPVVPARAAGARAATRTAPFAGTRSYRAVDTCAAEFAAETPYFYSGWERDGTSRRHEVRRGDKPSVVILGAGPNRIGQGIEFDYCCVHAAMTVRASGRDAVMINCNPETVSTDYDTSDRLYFEPLTLEDVLGVVEIEQPEGVIVQFGGQTPLKLAAGLQDARRADPRHERRRDRPRRGPRPLRRRCSTASATRRRRTRPRTASARRSPPARASASRCSCGRATCSAAARWRSSTTRPASPTTSSARGPGRARRARDLPRPLPRERDRARRRRALRRRARLDRRRSCSTSRRPGSTPATAPASCRRTRSGRRCSTRSATRRAASRSRSGRSASSTSSTPSTTATLYVIEANPRASRTVPFVSKAIGVPLAKMACRIMLGERIEDLGLPSEAMPTGHVSVKEAVLPFDRFAGSDALLGPGDALDRRGHGHRPRLPDGVRQGAGRGRRDAAATRARSSSRVTDGDKAAASGIAALLGDLGFRVVATAGTARRSAAWACASTRCSQKIGGEGRRTSSTASRPARSTSSSTRRPARARAPTAGRSAAPRSRAGSPASRRCRAATPPRARSPRPAHGEPRCCRCRRSTAHARRAGRRDSRVQAPFGRRRVAVTGADDVGAYRVAARRRSRRAAAVAGPVLHARRGRALGGGRATSGRSCRARCSFLGAADGQLSFMFEDVGPGTHRLGELRPGDELWLTGPLGEGFELPRDGRRALLVGGGVGIPPLAGWATVLAAHGVAASRRARLPRRAPTPRARRSSRTRRRDRHRRRLGRPPRPRHGPARRRARRATIGRRRLRLRPAAHARGRARALRRPAACPHSSRWRPAWRAASAPASAASWRCATAATSASASTARCSTRPASTPCQRIDRRSAASRSSTRSSTARGRSTRSPRGARSATRCSSASRSARSSRRRSRCCRARATRRRGCGRRRPASSTRSACPTAASPATSSTTCRSSPRCRCR